jgi:hypothetical protein
MLLDYAFAVASIVCGTSLLEYLDILENRHLLRKVHRPPMCDLDQVSLAVSSIRFSLRRLLDPEGRHNRLCRRIYDN